MHSSEKLVTEESVFVAPSDEWQHASIELTQLTQEPDLSTIIEEQELVHRLDKRLLLFAMFGNLVKALDNSNLGSAYISGMEEELNVTGIQYNWMGVLFTCGYLTMQLPSNILLSKARPSIYLPALESIWCILTLSMACVPSVKAVYCLRFLLGLAEAGFYPGIVFLIGTWYTKKELGKRLALLTICGSFGSGLSGVVQAVMLKTMDGVFGISGWRWMFVFDAMVTACLAYFGFCYLPDYPHNTSWLDKQEKAIAVKRFESAMPTGTKASAFTDLRKMGKLKMLLSNKYLYPFTFGWAGIHIAMGAVSVLGIVSKKLGYDAVTANLLTTPDTIITMIAGLCNGFLSDKYRTRIWCIVIPATFGLFGLSLLSAFVQPFPFLYVGFLITHAGLGSLSSIVMTWASEVISPHSEIRAMSIAIMNTTSSLMWTWVPLVLWPVTDAPYYHKGFTTGCVLTLLFIMSMLYIHYMQLLDGRVKRANSESDVFNQVTVIEEEEGEIPLLRGDNREDEDEDEDEESTMNEYHITSSSSVSLSPSNNNIYHPSTR